MDFLFPLWLFIAGLASQIVLLQINLWRYHKKNPDAGLVSSRWIFRFQQLDQIILPEVTEGMMLSSTLLLGYLYLRYATTFFGGQVDLSGIGSVFSAFLAGFVPYPLVFFLASSLLIGCFNFRLPSLLKFLHYVWFLICFVTLFFFFMGKLPLYFQIPGYGSQDPITMYFIGFNALPLLAFLMSLRRLLPNKDKSVIEQVGLMAQKIEDRQLSWQRTFLLVLIEGGLLLLNGAWHLVDDAAVIGFFLAIMPLLHYRPTKLPRRP